MQILEIDPHTPTSNELLQKFLTLSQAPSWIEIILGHAYLILPNFYLIVLLPGTINPLILH